MGSIEEKILSYFKTLPQVISVILFGSYAQNRANSQSDVDIAILCEGGSVPDSLTIISWREDLSAALHKEVDLICLNTASPIIGMQVHKNGKELSVKNSQEQAKYQMRLFTDYAELKELRAPMEKEILKRKYYDRS